MTLPHLELWSSLLPSMRLDTRYLELLDLKQHAELIDLIAHMCDIMPAVKDEIEQILDDEADKFIGETLVPHQDDTDQ